MAEIGTRDAEEGVEVLVGERVVHHAESQEAADALAQWVRFQLEGGTSLEALEAMMRGEEAELGEGAKPKVLEVGGEASADPRILEGAIGDLREALATGAHDEELPALLETEEAGKARKGALAAIRGRMEEVGE